MKSLLCLKFLLNSFRRINQFDYKKSPIQRAEIRRLKIQRDELLMAIMAMLEEKEYWIRKELFDCRGLLPIDWRTGIRKKGEENTEAPDWWED